MVDSRRYLGTFAVVSLVVLRLVIGWHFFREGSQKVVYDRHDGELRMVFSAEGFLTQAKGPLASWLHAQAPDDHGYRHLLAVPRENVPPDAADLENRAKWSADYAKRRAEAAKSGGEVPVEFPPDAPYGDWGKRIAEDWREMRDEVKLVPGLTDEQKQRVDKAYAARMQQAADYLAAETEPIAEYRHELWRLDRWQEAPESGEVPYFDERIEVKDTETASAPRSWINEVRDIGAQFVGDLREILSTEQRSNDETYSALESAITSDSAKRLHMVSVGATILTIGVGICLLLGFLTRIASIAGALFLLGVIISQPPWLADAAPTMFQVVEFSALLVLAGTGAGRWAGLDYFTYALFHRNRDVEP
ncbi:MAG TPA: DoxX family protein [Lacipirellulaceae bacterium]